MGTINFGRSDAAPCNIMLKPYIRAEHGHAIPVGQIHMAAQHPGIGWICADGRRLQIEHYPALYDIIGDTYCPRLIRRPARIGRLRRAWIWLTGKPWPRETVVNEQWAAGCFRVPNLWGKW